MEDRFRRYVDDLFEGTVLTQKAIEQKEEMIQNLQDKYRDLLSEGKDSESAYHIAISGIGDVSALLNELSRDESAVTLETARRKSAMLTAVAVMMYIVSVVPVILLSTLSNHWHGAIIGVVIMFLLAAAATGLLIYNHMTKPKSFPAIDEEDREWRDESNTQRSMRRAISSALWAIIFVLYFVISFSTGAWHITWVIFIAGSAVEAIIETILHVLRGRDRKEK